MLSSNLKKPAKVREIVLASLALLSLCYLNFTWFFSPKQKEINYYNTQLDKVVKEATSLKKLITVLDNQIKKTQQALDKQVAQQSQNSSENFKFSKYKTKKYKNISDFFQAITHPLFVAGLNITALKYNDTHNHGGFKSNTYTLEVEGRFSRITNLIDRLQNFPALVSIDQMSLKTKANDTSQVTLSLDGTFYQLETD